MVKMTVTKMMLTRTRSSAVGSIVLASLLLASCTGLRPLMPTPALHEGEPDLLAATARSDRTPTIEVLFATDRRYEPERSPHPYPPERGGFLRLGTARVRIGPEDMAWDELSELSSSRQRDPALTIQLTEVEDFGPHVETAVFFDPVLQQPDILEPAARYAAHINEQLARSRRKEICVYISQFNVDFDVAIMSAAELHHYLARDSVFIAYSWPSPTSTLRYFSASENAYRTRRLLRIFIEYLARETNAERINLMTYSAGARVLSGVLHELALDHSHRSDEEIRRQLRLGQVIFCAADIDRGAFLEHAADGAYRLAERMTIYTHPGDEILALSRTLYGWERLGQISIHDLPRSAIDELFRQEHVNFVDVSSARHSTRSGGHGYYRLSPDVSSDVLLLLGHGLPPAERGLVREPGSPVWHFPDGYGENLAPLRARLSERP